MGNQAVAPQKANFDVLEAFLTVFIGEPIKIIEILESEGNQSAADDDKFNRVGIKAKDSKDEIIMIEVQNTREIYYLERILYGVAKPLRNIFRINKRGQPLAVAMPLKKPYILHPLMKISSPAVSVH